MIRLSRSIVGEAEAAAVHRIICEDGYLGMGAEVQRFEQDLASYLGVEPESVVTVNSGTAALHLAVESLFGHNSGVEILVPSLTFVASFQAIGAAGAVPVACDVREDTGTIDLADAARKLTSRTRAIMPVHYASNPVDLDHVYAFARAHELRVVEDAAHAFGCLYKGKKIGSFGDVICFSFDGIKNITCGEGGCIVTADPAVASLARDGRLLSVEKDTEKRFSGQRSWDFDVKVQGWRYHMSNIMAAIGRVQLQRLDTDFAPKRCELARRYRQNLANVADIAFFAEEPEAFIVPHILPVRFLNGKRAKVLDVLDKFSIQSGQHYKPNHLLSLYGGGDNIHKSGLFPVSERLHEEILTLPLHPGLSLDDVDLVCGLVASALKD